MGGLSSWVLSGSHHVPPRRPVSSCGPGAQGRKLDTGPSTAGMLWERFVCVCVSVSVCVCVEKLWLTGGRLLSRVVDLPTNPPPQLNSTLPHPLCPLARHVLTQHPPQTHTRSARTDTSTHMASIKHGCMAPRKKV